MNIKILGTGCPSCIKLENNTKEAVKIAWNNAEIEKITNIAEIMNYNIMSVPALVIDEKIVSSGKVLSVLEILSLLKWETSSQEKNSGNCGCSCGGNC